MGPLATGRTRRSDLAVHSEPARSLLRSDPMVVPTQTPALAPALHRHTPGPRLSRGTLGRPAPVRAHHHLDTHPLRARNHRIRRRRGTGTGPPPLPPGQPPPLGLPGTGQCRPPGPRASGERTPAGLSATARRRSGPLRTGRCLGTPERAAPFAQDLLPRRGAAFTGTHSGHHRPL